MRPIAITVLLFIACGSSGQASRATIADTGLPPAQPGTKEGAIQAREAVAITNAYRALESAGIRTTEDWQRSAAAGAQTLSENPLGRDEMEARVETELAGDAYPEPAPQTVATIVEQQAATADEWAATLRAELPALSDEQLTAARIKITVGLAILQTQIDANAAAGEIDGQILDVIRQANQGMRAEVIAEMQARGLTE